MQAILDINKANFGKRDLLPIREPKYLPNVTLNEERISMLMNDRKRLNAFAIVRPCIVCEGYVITDADIWEAHKRLNEPVFYYTMLLEKGETFETEVSRMKDLGII